MTHDERKAIRDYCALLLKQHGFLFSPEDPVIPALYIIYCHTKDSENNNRILTQKIQEAITRINPREFHFHQKDEAWKFQLAGVAKWILLGLFFIVIALIGSWHWANENNVNAAREIVHASGSMSVMFGRVNRNVEGTYFIDFKAAGKDSVRHFYEYQVVDKKTVRVYLGRDSSMITR